MTTLDDAVVAPVEDQGGSFAAGQDSPAPDHIACRDYDAHRASELHVWGNERGWVCSACDSEVVA
jgi:hypothetical protein